MRRCSSKAAICAFSATLVIASAARAEDEEVEPAPVFELASDQIVVRTKTRESFVPIGCQPRSFTTLGTRAYALCGSRTIVIVDAMPLPHVVERRLLKVVILSLTVVDDVISARSNEGVRPLDAYAISHSPAATVAAQQTRDAAPDLTRHDRSPLPSAEAPPRTIELSLLSTGGIGVDSPIGAFAYFDAAAVFRGESHPFTFAAYGTFGGATGTFDPGNRETLPSGGDVQVAVGEALVGIDTRYFAISLGAGVGLFDQGYAVEPLFVTRGRVGERDRFEASWHMSFGVSGNTLVGVLGGAMEFRLTTRWWLGFDAELGNLHYGRFMIDARRRLIGNGGRHTLDLRASAGVAFVQSTTDCSATNLDNNASTDTTCNGTNASYLGPALSFGFVWRP